MAIHFNSLYEETLIVVPCYNAINTIEDTLTGILETGFFNIIVSDDKSDDDIGTIIAKYPVKYIKHQVNLGYGGNQKFLYDYAIANNYKFIIMVHGDFQYTPRLIPSMVALMAYANYDFVFGSRILGGDAIKNGMPILKYIANRGLTLMQNIITGYKLSEYHSGYRGYNLSVLKQVNFATFSNNFLFDNQMLLEIMKNKRTIGEVSCTTKYDVHSSSISYYQSFIYALGVIKLSVNHVFYRFSTK